MSLPARAGLRRRRRTGATLLVALAGVVTAGSGVLGSAPAARDRTPVAEAAGAQDAPLVVQAEVDSIIHPVSAEFMTEVMDRADAEGAALVVFTLRTPGGLLDSTRTIVTRMLGARTPVVVFIAPSGARAASAGFLITIAADVAAMAPGTHLGAAHPVSGNGEPADPVSAEKATQDVSAWARTLAETRGRNVSMAVEAVEKSRAYTAREAMDASPPLVDVIVPDLTALLVALDGRTIRRFDGTAVTLETSDARVVPIDMSTRQRVLSAIAHPNVAFILMSLGMLGLMVELWSPGAIFPGAFGAASLVLAFFGLQLLPVNYAGLLLLALGLLLLILEIKVTSYGMLTVGGLVCLVLGSMMLIDAPEPDLRLSLDLVLPVVAGFALIGLFLARLALRAQRAAPRSGTALLVGQTAVTLGPVSAAAPGQVRVFGEVWRAVSAEPIAPETRVTIVRVDGLTLTVERR